VTGWLPESYTINFTPQGQRASMIQLSRNGVADTSDVAALQQEFHRTRTFRIPGLIEQNVLASLLDRLERSAWTVREHKKIGMEASPEDSVVVYSLNFLANRPEFLDAARRITGIDGIKAFKGRIYRLADSTHYDSWHDDCTGTRLLGMSVNLGRIPYAGGVFRLREQDSDTLLCELPNTGPGDSIFFQIKKGLEHMVTAVEGVVPKTAFAGWFIGSEWDYYQDVRSIPAALAATTTL
jgi:hypothetical protein